MDISEQNILYNDCFTYLYSDQINEQNRITREITDVTERDDLLKNIVDEQERWIIDNCTPLFFIEKSSNILQEYVRNFNVEKIMIELVEYYKNNGLNIFETSDDGENAIRIINLKKIEFLTGNTLIRDTLYDKKIENIVASILGKIDNKEGLVVDFKTKQEIVFAITLTFGEYGGHYGLVFCKYDNNKWNICLIDPYTKTYVSIFEEIIRDIIELMTNRLNSTTENFGFGTFTNVIDLKVGSGIQELSYVETSAPSSDLEKYNVQTTNNQDHFCFMWCIYFFNKFLLYRWNNNIDYYVSITTLLNDVSVIAGKTFTEKLRIIKEYIIDDLVDKTIIELKGNTKTFFDNYFPCIWDDNSVKSDTIVTKSNFNKRKYDFNKFELYKLEKTAGSFALKRKNNKEFIYSPFIQFNGVKYVFNTGECLKIFNSLQTGLNIGGKIPLDSDNIVKLFYYKLYEIIQINIGIIAKNVTIPNKYYNDRRSSFNEKYFIANDINIKLSDTTLGCKNPEAKDVGKLLSLKDFSRDKKTKPKDCTDLGNYIDTRNRLFQSKKFTCKLLDNGIKLELYQETVYKIMKDKIEKSATDNRSINPGLLVWFGTGTGKTLAASVVAKMTGFCYNPSVPSNNFGGGIINKIVIISPKSAFINFKKELEQRLNISMNKFLKQDDLNKSGIENSFYFHGKNTNIFLFSHPIFNDLFMNDSGYVNDSPLDYYNKDFLKDALLIVDECHNYTSYDTGPNKTTLFMTDCCKTVKQVLLLTATPIVNTPFDLEILMSYLDGRDIGTKKNFTKEYFGKFENPFFKTSGGNIDINENHLSLTKTFDTTKPDPNWGIGNNKIGIIPSKNDISIQITDTATKPKDEIKNYFSNRIIYYMTENQTPSPLPEYNEKIYYVFWDNQRQYNNYVNNYLKKVKINKNNKEKEGTNAFNSEENVYIWKSDIMLQSILNIIKTRESAKTTQEINNIVTTGLRIDLRRKFNTMSYKYIIFCIFKENIDLLNAFLSRYIEPSLIGVIRGDTSAEERKQIASDYDEGIKKIVILSKAGEEGVDFKRTGVIILADGVWTSAEYDQILGRAVRKNSNLRLRDNKDDPTLDPNTLIPDKIECISILLTVKYQQNSSDIIKYSGDLRQFKIILTKRAITKQVIDELQPYFYKMIDVVDKTESTLPIGTPPNSATINELSIPNTLYDGIRKTKNKSRRRSTRRKSKSKRRSSRHKSKSKRRRKSKSKRRHKSKY